MKTRDFVLGSKIRLIMLILIVLMNHSIVGIVVTGIVMAIMCFILPSVINAIVKTLMLPDIQSKVATWIVGLIFVLRAMQFFDIPRVKLVMFLFTIVVAIITGVYMGLKHK